MSTPLKEACAVCNSTEKLSQCEGCLVMPYCSEAHRAYHESTHKEACIAIQARKKHLDQEEHHLRNPPPNSRSPSNLFEDHVGHFWGIVETQDYMKARVACIHALLKVNTVSAAQTALDHAIDLLRLLLRLERDQDCHDFIRWWEDKHEGDAYLRENVSLPWLELKDVDVFADNSDPAIRKNCDLAFTVAITLVKIRVQDSLQAMLNPARLRQRLGSRLSDAVTRNPRMKDMTTKEIQEHIAGLEAQIENLYFGVREANVYFWEALIDAWDFLTMPLHPYEKGSMQEMQACIQYSYDSWAEPSGAIGDIFELMLRHKHFTDQ